KDFYSAHFRTSLYNTFNEKMDALDFSSNWFLPLFINEGSSVTIDRFGVYAAGNEYFDEFDQEGYFNGDEDIPSLIQLEANTDITADNWFNNTVGDIMYDHFPQEPDMVLSWRDTDILGETPTRAVTLEQNATPHRLTEDDKLNGTAAVPLPQTGVVYDLPINIIRDYFEYAQDAADYIVDNSVVPDEIIELDEWSFIYPDFGDYGVQVRYILPGTTTPSTERQLIIPYGTNN
ncbi:MAG: hypothetical protein AAFY48_06895, partial [Bacteroidota bacterium]